jgi:hypothetical protein
MLHFIKGPLRVNKIAAMRVISGLFAENPPGIFAPRFLARAYDVFQTHADATAY